MKAALLFCISTLALAHGRTIEGEFRQSTGFQFSGDAIGGRIRRVDSISASGEIVANPQPLFAGRVHLGHVETEGEHWALTDFVGIVLENGGAGKISARPAVIGHGGGFIPGPAVSLDAGAEYSWAYEWSPTGGAVGGGILRCRFIRDGVTLASAVNPQQTTQGFKCNAFGLWAGYNATSAPETMTVSVSGASYSTLPRPESLPEFMRVFILLGQSNARGADGRPIAFEASEWARSNTFIWNDGEWQFLRPGNQHNIFGPEIAFAATLADRLGAPVGIIKRAISGAGLEAEFIPDANRSFPLIVENARAAVAALPSPILSGVLAVQGESDAATLAMASRYGANMAALIDGFRAELQDAELPMIVSRLPIWGTPVFKEPIRAAQSAWPWWFDTDDLTPADTIHFDRAGVLEIGRRFANAFCEFAKNPQIRGGLFLTVPDLVECSDDLTTWAPVNVPSAMPVPRDGNRFFRAR